MFGHSSHSHKHKLLPTSDVDFNELDTIRPAHEHPQEVLTIFTAAQQGRLTFIKENLGEDVNILDAEGCSILHWASINNHCHVASFLLKVPYPSRFN
jgi:ankyrin repeat protein